MLIASSEGDGWIFESNDIAPVLEESIRFSGPERPRKSEQLVLHATLEGTCEIKWSMEWKGKSRARRKSQNQSAHAEPDLLSGL